MDKELFIRLRKYFGLSQSQLATILDVSPKTVQSYEQGRRSIPVHIYKTMLFFLYLRLENKEQTPRCWEIRDCPLAVQEKCPAVTMKAAGACWLISGTLCWGEPITDWQEKIRRCFECPVWTGIRKKILEAASSNDMDN